MNIVSPSEAYARLVQDEWEFRMVEDPVTATYTGDQRFNDRLPGVSEADYTRRLEKMREFQRELEKIDPVQLSDQERLDYGIFKRLLENEIGELEFQAFRFPVAKVGGIHTYLAEMLPEISPFATVTDYENYLSRLQAVPIFFDQSIELMRSSLDRGYVPARVTVQEIPETLQVLLATPVKESLFFTPFLNFPAGIESEVKDTLTGKAVAVIEGAIQPAYRRLLDFLEAEYIPGARDEIAATNLPNGREFYQHRILYFSSLGLTPEQVHGIGLSEVQRIRQEMEAVIREVNFTGGFQEFIQFLRRDERFYVSKPEELLKETAYLLKRIDGELPRLFKTLPRTPYGIKPVPEASAPGNTTAYYFPPTGDGRSAGFYYVNTYDLKSRPLYELEALSLHEAVPGHHLQIALQQELDLPNFRRFGGFTAFVEGWALYAERLGLEMGFYQDPYSNFGRLSYEMWRACRLVVDTGMHALGWTRQQAIDFMTANTSSTLLNITNEVDRYIAWPGQALAYKLGEIKIRELRNHAEKRLGNSFDLRVFHEIILGSGAVPLDVLEEMVESWISQVIERQEGR